jgi:hypothetical protein
VTNEAAMPGASFHLDSDRRQCCLDLVVRERADMRGRALRPPAFEFSRHVAPGLRMPRGVAGVALPNVSATSASTSALFTAASAARAELAVVALNLLGRRQNGRIEAMLARLTLPLFIGLPRRSSRS